MEDSTNRESAIKLRSYQEEMLEASMRRNVIVAMETGSGKTHVAAFRILAELQRTDSSKLVWFMSPRVALSTQQHEMLSSNLPGYLTKLLTGRDGVDKWTDQRLWDDVLTNVRLVVGTPQVLQDALTHGFVHISRLALLVFDEAHHCIKDSPMNSIMRNFYHPAKALSKNVPHILGLTASPVKSAEAEKLATIEANLDAITVTPKRHRSELESFVHPPEMASILYNPVEQESVPLSCLGRALNKAHVTYDLESDPCVLELSKQRLDGDYEADKQLQKVFRKQNTFCSTQLKALCQRNVVLTAQLGCFAADWYIQQCLQRFQSGLQNDTLIQPDMTEQENKHLGSIFEGITAGGNTHCVKQCPMNKSLTEKAHLLVEELKENASSTVRAIVFVEQRAVVTALAHLLRSHAELKPHYRIGTSVGMSTSEHRKASVVDLVDLKDQERDLEDFRSGAKNLIVATSVLEEGIDVSACNLVICFDPPKTLVSFVQRRGRARRESSRYTIFLPNNDLRSAPASWSMLEEQMKQAYMDELRALPNSDDADGETGRQYRVEDTGALLTSENAKQHLYHFCAVGTSDTNMHMDLRPEFDVETIHDSAFTATVTLPAFVHKNHRFASSTGEWQSEEIAIKDAAFNAYVELHEAGLVNDNLLPLTKNYAPMAGEQADQPSIIDVAERQSAWIRLSEAAAEDEATWGKATLKITLRGHVTMAMVVYLPTGVPPLEPIELFWNKDDTYRCEILSTSDSPLHGHHDELIEARAFTLTMLSTIYGNRMDKEASDFPVLFGPDGEIRSGKAPCRNRSAAELVGDGSLQSEGGIATVKSRPGKLWFFDGVSQSDAVPEAEQQVLLRPFPRRRDFLHPISQEENPKAAYTTRHKFPISECTIKNTPRQHAQFAAFAPSIIHRLEVALTAREIQTTLLRDVDVGRFALVIEAISAPAASEPADYNRLEFLGDVILKFCASLHVQAKHLNWPEGYLTLEKSRIVSNANQTQAALAAGLDRYILTKSFTGHKWRPVYISEMLSSHFESKREMSSKTLADVVEALIGAAFVDGGLEKAFTCVRALSPEESWQPQEESLDALLGDMGACKKGDLGLLQDLVGHEFKHPILILEAITHASFPKNRDGLSYERLEFLGDAVLDLIIVPKLHAHPSKLKHWQMHRIRQALANADFLGYCSMNCAVSQQRYETIPPTHANGSYTTRQTSRQVHLHDYLRCGAPIQQSKRKSLRAFDEHHESISQALAHGDEYPWPALVALRPQKFFSDMIESVLGALYLDTRGDLDLCEAFLEKLGVLPYMRRVLEEGVETAFPRERVGILAGKEKVEYLANTREEGEDGVKVWDCVLAVGEEEVVGVEGCGTREEAKVKAADEGARVLRERLAVKGDGKKRRKLDFDVRGGDVVEAAIVDGDDVEMVDEQESEGGVSLM